MAHDFDLITLGAGSGGVAASRRAAAHGARVAIVEAGRVGGTCVLRGCVPKKLLMYAAQFGDAFADARGYGWAFGQDAPAFDMARWQAAKTAETDRLEGIYRQMLSSAKVTLIEGHARLSGRGCVVVRDAAGGERAITAAHVLIATGAAPVRDSIPGIEACATSDDLLDLATLPSHAAVIGGGYIAVEFASMLARLGVKVSLFFRDTQVLRGFDAMLRLSAMQALGAAGVELNPGSVPSKIDRGGVGGAGFALWFGERLRNFDWVLNATGRRPNSAGLGLETIGVQAGPKAAVPVSTGSRTTADGVYAIGDVTDRNNLTPVAIAEGRALADTLFGGMRRELDLSLVASAVFMLPTLASVGPTEQALAALGRLTKVYETDFRSMKQAFIGGTERTRMKLLVDAATDKVLAVHMAGHDAPEIVQSLAVALTAGATKAHFDATVAVHPTAAEEFVLMREPIRTVGAST